MTRRGVKLTADEAWRDWMLARFKRLVERAATDEGERRRLAEVIEQEEARRRGPGRPRKTHAELVYDVESVTATCAVLFAKLNTEPRIARRLRTTEGRKVRVRKNKLGLTGRVVIRWPTQAQLVRVLLKEPRGPYAISSQCRQLERDLSAQGCDWLTICERVALTWIASQPH